MSNGDAIFIEIGDTRDPIYRTLNCSENHVHLRICAANNPEIDLIFTTPADAYEFAETVLRAFDRAEGIAAPR